MLILDEAVSALDYLTERTVCENLRRELSAILSSLLLTGSQVRSADSIMLMKPGCFGIGTHQQLLAVRVSIMPFTDSKMPLQLKLKTKIDSPLLGVETFVPVSLSTRRKVF